MKNLRNHSGISLIELIIGASIFALAVAGFFSTFYEVSRISKESVQTQRAYQILEGVLDNHQFSSNSYARLPSRDSVVIKDSSVVLLDAKGLDLAALLTVSIFRVNYKAGAIEDIPAKKVQGILAWQRGENVVEQCTLETVIAMTAGVD